MRSDIFQKLTPFGFPIRLFEIKIQRLGMDNGPVAECFFEQLRLNYDQVASGSRDVPVIMQAIKFLNAANCEASLSNALQRCATLTRANAEDDKFPCWSDPNLSPHCYKGSDSTDMMTLLCLKSVNHLFRGIDESEKDQILMGIETQTTAEKRVQVFSRVWNKWAEPERMLWVGDYHAPSAMKCAELHSLIGNLGLYHMGKVQEDYPFLLLTLDVSHRRKPTWIDADLTFYFYGRDAAPSQGHTLSLWSGRPALPEWVTQKQSVQIADARILRADRDFDYQELEERFWNSLADEVASHAAPPASP